jgi:hypothetical protein
MNSKARWIAFHRWSYRRNAEVHTMLLRHRIFLMVLYVKLKQSSPTLSVRADQFNNNLLTIKDCLFTPAAWAVSTAIPFGGELPHRFVSSLLKGKYGEWSLQKASAELPIFP